MRVQITESIVGAELKSLLDEIKDNLNFKLVTDKEDEKDYTLIIKGKILNDTLFIHLIHKYNNGNTWNTLFTIRKNVDGMFIIDSSDETSLYNFRYHEPFSSSAEVVDYIRQFEL